MVDVLNAEPERGPDRAAGLARRIWRMEQQAIRFSLPELGIPVVHWDGERAWTSRCARIPAGSC